MFAFRFVAIRPFVFDLENSIQGQGQDENRPKSNQVV